jgi:tetratricopeptide (TPR) repeat protein
MEASEIIEALERLHLAASLGQLDLVAQLQARLVDRARGVSASSQAAVAAGQGRWQAVLDCGADAPGQVELRRWNAALRARALLELGRLESALDAARDLLREAPGDADARVLAGRCLFRLRRLEEAEAELRRALEVAPDHFEGRYGLGLVLMARAQLQPALVELRHAQRVNPLDEGPYRALARLFRMTGQVSEGAERIGSLMAGQLVAGPGLLLDLAELELLAGRTEGVPAKLMALEEHAALEPLHLLDLARLWCELVQPHAVQRLAVRAEGSDHPQAGGVATTLRALEAELAGDGETARQLHSRACTQLRGHWFPHSRAALLYLYRRDERGLGAAQAHLREAARLAPRQPDVRLLVAILHVAQGDHSVRPSLELVTRHAGLRPSLRRIARATLEMMDGEGG